MKYCRKCNKYLELSNFYADSRNCDGAYSYCKSCHNKNRRVVSKNGSYNYILDASKSLSKEELFTWFTKTYPEVNLNYYKRLLKEQEFKCSCCGSKKIALEIIFNRDEIDSLVCKECLINISR